jgi:glycerol-3-phosphate acyltransferase PlsX
MSVTVAVDANGADQGPAEVARGAAEAAAAGTRVLLFGPAAEFGPPPGGVEVVDAPVSIAKAPDPARAVRNTPEASIVQAAVAVADGRADALVSGGSTGAALAAALFRVKRARGVHRPALAILVPVPEHPFLLLDAGANVEVRSEHLVQFAHMGAAFMEVVMGVERPRVALLSNGEEATKGTEDVVAAHAALRERPGALNFVGNVEGFAIGSGAADVIVADGFTGNVALKVMEGTMSALFGAVRGAALSNVRRARPRGAWWRAPARAAAARRRAARLVRRARLRTGDRGGRARRSARRGRTHARAAGRRRGAPAAVRGAR